MTTTNQVELSYAVESTPGVADSTATRRLIRYTAESLESSYEFEDSPEVDGSGEIGTLIRLENAHGGVIESYQLYDRVTPFIESLVGRSLQTVGIFYGPDEDGMNSDAAVTGQSTDEDAGTSTYFAARSSQSANRLPGKEYNFNGFEVGDIAFLYGDPGVDLLDGRFTDTSWRRILSVNENSDGDIESFTVAGTTYGNSVGFSYNFLFVRKMVADIAALSRRFTIQKYFSDLNMYHNYYGCLVDGVRLSWQAGSAPSVAVSLVAQRHDITSTTQLADSVESTFRTEPYNVEDINIIVFDENLRDLQDLVFTSITLDLQRLGRPSYGLGSRDPNDIGLGLLSVTGSFEIYFQSVEVYDQFLSNEYLSLFVSQQDPSFVSSVTEDYRDGSAFGTDTPAEGISADQLAFNQSILREYYEIPRLVVTQAQVVARGAGRPLLAQFDFQAVKDESGAVELLKLYNSPVDRIPNIYRRAFLDHRIFNSQPVYRSEPAPRRPTMLTFPFVISWAIRSTRDLQDYEVAIPEDTWVFLTMEVTNDPGTNPYYRVILLDENDDDVHFFNPNLYLKKNTFRFKTSANITNMEIGIPIRAATIYRVTAEEVDALNSALPFDQSGTLYQGGRHDYDQVIPSGTEVQITLQITNSNSFARSVWFAVTLLNSAGEQVHRYFPTVGASVSETTTLTDDVATIRIDRAGNDGTEYRVQVATT